MGHHKSINWGRGLTLGFAHVVVAPARVRFGALSSGLSFRVLAWVILPGCGWADLLAACPVQADDASNLTLRGPRTSS
ncbi:unnamed protein product [Victoria cruziana]